MKHYLIELNLKKRTSILILNKIFYRSETMRPILNINNDFNFWQLKSFCILYNIIFGNVKFRNAATQNNDYKDIELSAYCLHNRL